MATFEEELEKGKLGESLIAQYLNRRGWHVLPAYEIETTGKEKKGPRLFCADRRQLITPDLLCWKGKRIQWVECKTKSAFFWYFNGGYFTTGIDTYVWEHYKHVMELTGWPVILLFVHLPGSPAPRTPAGKVPPVGVYGADLGLLEGLISPDCGKYGHREMIYWDARRLPKICEYTELTTARRAP